MSNNVMNKTMLTKALSQRTGLSQADVKAVLEAQGIEIKQALQNEQNVILPELGTLTVTRTKERKGVNPRSREVIHIPSKAKIVFKSTAALNLALNPKE